MASVVLDRPALGQVAALGSFYDARTDTFIPLSLFRSPPPIDAIATTKNHSTITKYSETDTFKDKLDFLGVKAELGASILAGLVSVEGSGRYLSDTRNSNLVAQASMHYSITTVDEKLNITANGVAECLAFRALDTDVATHVVVGITWGARCVVSAKKQVALSASRGQVTGEVQSGLSLLKLFTVSADAGGGADKDATEVTIDRSFELTVHGDVLANDGVTPTDFDGARSFVRSLPKYIECANDGKGKPISYTLMPLTLLSMFNLVEVKADLTLHQLSLDCLDRFVKLFDDFHGAKQKLYDYHTRLQSQPTTVPHGHLQEVHDMLGRLRGWEATAKSDYASILEEVRSGKADAQKLSDFLEKCRSGELSTNTVKSLMCHVDKMDFVDLIVRDGAKYVGYGGPTLSTLLLENQHDDAYVMYFNDDLRTSSEGRGWSDATAVLLELLRDRSRSRLMVVVDCDAVGSALEKIYVSQLRNGHVIVEDVLEQRKILATNCVMRYDGAALDRAVRTKPLQRRAVKVHCPQSYCDRTLQPSCT